MPRDDLFEPAFSLPAVGRDEFDGATYSKDHDFERLKGQLQKVFEVMSDGEYRTLRAISDEVGASEASVSARLRDLRKRKFGGYTVDRMRSGPGLWSYAVKLEGKTSWQR